MIKWETFTNKQLQLLTWWTENSPEKMKNGVIAEGSIRAGKTLLMSLSFVVWAMSSFKKQQFAICGKSIGSLNRNVITPLKEVLRNRGYKVIERKTDNLLMVSNKDTTNIFYLFGGKDESSQDLIQGVTLAGVLFDEVALMPKSFVEQALGRCSVDGSKFWFNCNPEGPQHWFYVEHVLQAEQKGYLRLHFRLEDNPSLTKAIVNRYKSMFTGIFYKRFILGEWTFADGVVYDCFDEEKNTYTNTTRENILPLPILENDSVNGGSALYGSDYGVNNPMVFLEGYKIRKPGDRVPYFYIDNEYCYKSKENYTQKTDEEYAHDFIKLNNNKAYKYVAIDPSASSLIASFRKKNLKVIKADNDVEEGIRMVYALMATGHILINKDNCPNLISELGLYVWDAKRAENGVEKVVKKNDHSLDALRYMIKTTTRNYEVF